MPRQAIAVTVDSVVFCTAGKENKVLLIQRGQEPFQGQWALPGGFLEEEETLESGAKRELEEETGIRMQGLLEVGAFGEPGRDPRGRTISVAFWGVLGSEKSLKAADDAAEARWFPVDELPPLAFDHKRILQAAMEKFSERKFNNRE